MATVIGVGGMAIYSRGDKNGVALAGFWWIIFGTGEADCKRSFSACVTFLSTLSRSRVSGFITCKQTGEFDSYSKVARSEGSFKIRRFGRTGRYASNSLGIVSFVTFLKFLTARSHASAIGWYSAKLVATEGENNSSVINLTPFIFGRQRATLIEMTRCLQGEAGFSKGHSSSLLAAENSPGGIG